jgi:undecaprenyl-diphosphatase
MNFFTAVILGIVEGVSEFLPISSTGHLILTSHLLKIPTTEFLKSFEIAIQLGTILSVVFLYWQSFLIKFEALKKIIVAFSPTALIGFALYKAFKTFLLTNTSIVLWSLLIGGIFIIVFELLYHEKNNSAGDISQVSYRQAFLIGIFQAIAIIPGVSRSAATIIGGMILGLKRKTIVEFSFLLAVPTMLAATAFDLVKSAHEFNGGDFIYLAVGFFVSFITAMLAIKFLLYFIKNHNFISFGIYRIIFAILMFLAKH